MPSAIETYTLVLRTLQNQLAPLRVAIEAAPISPEHKNQFNLHITQLTQSISIFPTYLIEGRLDLAERAAKAAIAHYRDALVFAQSIVYPAVADAVAQSVSWERLLQTLPPSLRPPSASKIKKYLLIAGVVGIGGFFIWRKIAKEKASEGIEFISEHPKLLAAL